MILFLRIAPGLSIALEERDRPELHAHPVVVGRPGGHGLICEVNSAAHYCGISPGMTTAQARHHCPDVRLLTLDLARVAAVGEEICAILHRFTPLVQPVGSEGVVCDVGGCERSWNDAEHLARSVGIAIREEIGLSASIGIGSNRLVAELASGTADPGSMTLVERGQERAFLADLPLTALPEVDPAEALTFAVLGLIRVGQFAALPAAAVKNRFGARGVRLHRYAGGIDPRPVVPPLPRRTISVRYECEEGTPEEALEGLRRLATQIGQELQERCLHARIVTLHVFWKLSRSPSTSGKERTRRRKMREAGTPSLQLRQATSTDAPAIHEGATAPIRWEAPAIETREPFSIPYRIHSYGLPQPNGNLSHPLPVKREETAFTKQTHFSPPRASTDTLSAMVRTPIGTEGALSKRAEQLLLERLTKLGREQPPSLAAIELEVSGFAQPEQMGFAELNRIGETGSLEGMSPERRNTLLHSDETWAARHGATAFRHVAAVDPTNVVTERRVRWAEGLRT